MSAFCAPCMRVFCVPYMCVLCALYVCVLCALFMCVLCALFVCVLYALYVLVNQRTHNSTLILILTCQLLLVHIIPMGEVGHIMDAGLKRGAHLVCMRVYKHAVCVCLCTFMTAPLCVLLC